MRASTTHIDSMSTRHSTEISAPFDAVVFDFDGVIIDTELPLFRAWQEVFELHACEPLSVEEWGGVLRPSSTAGSQSYGARADSLPLEVSWFRGQVSCRRPIETTRRWTKD